MTQQPAPDGAPVKRGRGRPRLDDEMIPRILSAAEVLFGSRGALNVSIRDIAAEAGLSHSAIYRYFDSKDEILREVLKRGQARQIEQVHADAAGEIRGTFDWVMQNNRAYAMAVAYAALEGQTPSSLGLDPALSAEREGIESLANLRSEGVTLEHDPRVLMAAMSAMVIGWVVAEDWLCEVTDIEGTDSAEIRSQLDGILRDLVAMAVGGRG